MPADLAALGIVPPDEHSDAQLLALIAKRDKRHDEWNALRGEGAHLRLLAKWKKDCPVRRES